MVLKLKVGKLENLMVFFLLFEFSQKIIMIFMKLKLFKNHIPVVQNLAVHT